MDWNCDPQLLNGTKTATMADIDTILTNYLTHDEASFAVGYLEQAAKNAVRELDDEIKLSRGPQQSALINIKYALELAINNVRQQARLACKQ